MTAATAMPTPLAALAGLKVVELGAS